MATLIDLVQRTITRLSMVSGPGSQTYAEDRIAEMIWHKFIVLRSELWWDDMMSYATLTCGSDGFPIEPVIRQPRPVPLVGDVIINRFSDVQHVWNDDDPNPIPQMPRRMNIRRFQNSGKPRMYAPDATRVIRFIPAQVGRIMQLRYRQYYAYFAAGEEVPMDEQALILGSCYDYLEDDGTNPSQIEKFRLMFDARVQQLKSEENSGPIPISGVA